MHRSLYLFIGLHPGLENKTENWKWFFAGQTQILFTREAKSGWLIPKPAVVRKYNQRAMKSLARVIIEQDSGGIQGNNCIK